MIARSDNRFPIRVMSRLLRVSPSGYYASQRRHPSPRALENAQLVEEMHMIHTEYDGVYGSPKMWQEVWMRGKSCGQHRVARLMKQAGLQGIPSRKRWRGRKAGDRPKDVTNHQARDFSAKTPNTKGVTDITYTPTGEGWLYLAVILDACSRQVIGWSMQPQPGCEVVIQAVLMAVGQRTVVLHLDRGTQYMAREYQALLKAYGILSSMSGVGNCNVNAVAESFFGLLKRERVNRHHYETRAEARADVFNYIEQFYNRRRRHSHTEGLPPGVYAKQILKTGLLPNRQTLLYFNLEHGRIR